MVITLAKAHMTGTARSQLLLLPETVDDYLGPENQVRLIETLVNELDLQGLGFARATAEATGRPGHHPADMLKLYIYGDLNRLRSSWRLEAEARRNIEVIWLLRHLKPGFKAIADFRREGRAAAICRLMRDRDIRIRTSCRRASRQHDLPRLHSGNERRQLPPCPKSGAQD